MHLNEQYDPKLSKKTLNVIHESKVATLGTTSGKNQPLGASQLVEI